MLSNVYISSELRLDPVEFLRKSSIQWLTRFFLDLYSSPSWPPMLARVMIDIDNIPFKPLLHRRAARFKPFKSLERYRPCMESPGTSSIEAFLPDFRTYSGLVPPIFKYRLSTAFLPAPYRDLKLPYRWIHGQHTGTHIYSHAVCGGMVGEQGLSLSRV